MAAPPPLAVAAQQQRPPFFQTSLLKIGVLTVATLGLYQLSWIYRQWARRKEHGEDVIPLLRTIFFVLYAYSLFKSVNEEIDLRADLELAQHGSITGDRIEHLRPGLLTALYLGSSVTARFATGQGLGGILNALLASVPLLLTTIPLVFVQKKINELHAKLGYDPSAGTAFTGGSTAALVLGALFWILVVIGLFGGQGAPATSPAL